MLMQNQAVLPSERYVVAKFHLLLTSLLLLIHQVLDSGRLKEYDEPYILLQAEESLFYKMVQQVGKAEAASLIETAKQVKLSQQPLPLQNVVIKFVSTIYFSQVSIFSISEKPHPLHYS